MRHQYLVIVLAFVLAYTTFGYDNNLQYGEQYRPAYHFSAPQNWINDPIGLVYFQGLYHLYYQYNPYSNIWGNMSWGHAVSTDLVYWTNLPVAMYPYNNTYIFSGSTIVDVNNTSGFCEIPALGCLVAYYTAHRDFSDGSLEETESCAYSNNFGTTFTQYEKNPLINDTGRVAHRDPKVFWYAEGSKWVMITAIPSNATVRLYDSTDLLTWNHISDFGPTNPTAGGWEDPDLYQLAVDGDESNKKWVFSHAAAVSRVEYVIGDFDGTTFTQTNNVTQIIDYGRDFSEAASYNNDPLGRRMMMAWFDEGQYGGELPERSWRGSLTLVRELKLASFPEGLSIVQSVPDAMSKLRDTNTHLDNVSISAGNNVTLNVSGAQLEIIVTFQVPQETTDDDQQFGVNVFVGDGQITTIGYNINQQLLYVNRTDSGVVNFDPTFSGVCNQTLTPVNGTINLRMFVDANSVEVFANDGRVAMSNLIFPDATKDQVELFAIGGDAVATSVDVWNLKSIWPNNTIAAEEPKVKEFLSLLESI